MKDPFAGGRIGLDTRRVKDFGGEVATEEAPSGAIRGGGDVLLVAVEDLTSGGSGWSIGKDGTILDQGLVGQKAVGDEDCEAGTYVERDDGTVLGVKVAEDGLQL